jgi:hypothetical protein
VGVWAGDDSPSKRDRQPSLLAWAQRARREAAALSPKKSQKSAVSPTRSRAEANGAVRSQPSRHSLVDSLVYNCTMISVLSAYTARLTLSTFHVYRIGFPGENVKFCTAGSPLCFQ